jgi:hypothetical protein
MENKVKQIGNRVGRKDTEERRMKDENGILNSIKE